MNKKFIITSIIVALLIVATITISSYAYFTISNKEGDETVITSGTMTLRLDDGNEITSNNMLPGESIEKEFSVTNTGNIASSYDVYLSEVINNFADKSDLVFEITSLDGGYNTSNQLQVPSVSSKIIDNYPIEVGKTHNYKLKITFLNKDENQDDNQGKTFSAKIQVNEYKDIETTVNYYLDNQLVDEMPNNTKKYISSSCDKNALISFNEDNWEYELININQNNTTCNMYFEIPEYTLTYDYNYTGSTPSITTIKDGSEYGMLPTAERTDYDFLGWYTDPVEGELVNSSDVMSGDITIYAHWIFKYIVEALDYPMITASGWKNVKYINRTNSSDYQYGLDLNVNCTANDALDKAAYDGDESTYVDVSSGKKWFKFGSDIYIYYVAFKTDATSGYLYWWDNHWSCISISGEAELYNGYYHTTYYGKNSGMLRDYKAEIGVRIYEIKYDSTIP